LPAVFLSKPELFDEHRVGIASTMQDLKSGTLRIDESAAATINMPTEIVNKETFMQILCEAWSRNPL